MSFQPFLVNLSQLSLTVRKIHKFKKIKICFYLAKFCRRSNSWCWKQIQGAHENLHRRTWSLWSFYSGSISKLFIRNKIRNSNFTNNTRIGERKTPTKWFKCSQCKFKQNFKTEKNILLFFSVFLFYFPFFACNTFTLM